MDHRACDARIAQLEALVESLQKTIEAQAAEIADLKRRLGEDSTNSHKPPSSDPPHRPPREKRERGKRQPGGQPGHQGHARELLPVSEVHDVHDHKPTNCGNCGRKLRGEDPAPQRRQVWEIPPVEPTVEEHRLHSLECAGCGKHTRASLPVGVPAGAFGPRLEALVGLLTGAYRISKRNVVQLLSDCFGVRVSLGSIKRIEDDLSNTLAAPTSEAKAFVRSQPVAQLDETSWWQCGKKAWLWTAATALVVVFVIRFSRGSKVAKELIGKDYPGRVVSDRWSGYKWIPIKRRQICWSHLKRDFQKIVEVGGEIGAIGEALQAQRKQLFEWWHRVRDGTLKRSTFKSYVCRLRAKVQDLLRQGAACSNSKIAGMCRDIQKHEPAMWTFVRVEGVNPTNNHAERVIRPAVIWRKTSFGTQSDAGSTFVERMLTVAGTLRLQGRNILDYLTEACEAALFNRPAPSLLPQPTSCQSTAA